MPSLPPESLWTQFGIVGIIVLVLIVAALGVRKFWKEFTGWLDEQDQKRETEREKQRIWSTEQNRLREEAQDKRDQAWQQLIAGMQREQQERTRETNALLADLVNQMKGLGQDLRNHDMWARGNYIDPPTGPTPRPKRG